MPDTTSDSSHGDDGAATDGQTPAIPASSLPAELAMDPQLPLEEAPLPPQGGNEDPTGEGPKAAESSEPDATSRAEPVSAQQPSPAKRQEKPAGSNRRGQSTRRPSPSSDNQAPKLTGGDYLECRLARMYFWQGSFARLGIDLQRHFHPDPLLVTDLDLLAYEITSQLDLVKTIGEAKSGTSKTTPKPLDRAIWLGGLMRLVGASRAQLVTALVPSPRVREVARALGVHAIAISEIDRWEATWLIPEIADAGAHGPSAFIAAKNTRALCKNDAELERAYWFLRSEVWFLGPWQATNRLIGLLGKLATHWVPEVDDDITKALRWLYAEAISVLSLQLVALTGRSREADVRVWSQLVSDQLAEGSVPAHNMRALADGFDKYLGSVLSATNASNQLKVESMGAFHPQPPAWTDQLLDLLNRFAASPAVRDLPRYLDLILHERLVKRRHVDDVALDQLRVSHRDALENDRRLLAAFLRGAVGLPEPVAKAVST